MNLTTCPLCHATEKYTDINTEIYNTPLFETSRFLVMPSRGPLLGGQAMIVSKGHDECLAKMGEDSIIEFIKLVRAIINQFNDSNLLFYEHGSYDEHKGGSCIDHTHIHIIPTLGHLYSSPSSILLNSKDFNKMDELFELNNVTYPYILTFNSEENIVIYEAYNVHSQMMRKILCNILNRQDWDWKADDKTDLIVETVKLWKEVMI